MGGGSARRFANRSCRRGRARCRHDVGLEEIRRRGAFARFRRWGVGSEIELRHLAD